MPALLGVYKEWTTDAVMNGLGRRGTGNTTHALRHASARPHRGDTVRLCGLAVMSTVELNLCVASSIIITAYAPSRSGND